MSKKKKKKMADLILEKLQSGELEKIEGAGYKKTTEKVEKNKRVAGLSKKQSLAVHALLDNYQCALDDLRDARDRVSLAGAEMQKIREQLAPILHKAGVLANVDEYNVYVEFAAGRIGCFRISSGETDCDSHVLSDVNIEVIWAERIGEG